MEPGGIRIRGVRPEDAAALAEIYGFYVEKTAVTFEYQPPTPEEFRRRMADTLERYPYLAAVGDREVLGCAYTGPFHTRAAYAWAAETSIYVKNGCRRPGLGRRLYQALEEISREQGILNLNACIACPKTEDRYLTRDSVEFHRRLGYRMVGEFSRCGYKFGRWYNMVWMEKHLAPHPQEPVPVKPFPRLSPDWDRF